METRKSYTDEFKKQIMALYENGKPAKEIIAEYGLGRTNFYTWVKQDKSSGSFRTKNNLTDEQRRLKELEKENKRLLMEVDILKQAALIIGRK